MFVVSFWIVLAMPKSISLSVPSTKRKFAGLRSECTMRSSWIAATASSICCQYSRMKFSSGAKSLSVALAFSFRESILARSISPHSRIM